MKKIAIFGASGHGKVIVDILQSNDNKEIVEVIYDDNPKVDEILSIQVLKTDNNIEDKDKNWIIGVGNNSIRKMISNIIKGNFSKAVHPSAVISKSSFIDEGTVVMANAVVNPEVKIGKHAIINSGAVVEHDCVLEDFVHISPNASLAGGVVVGEGSHIGIGACVIQGITIGKWSVIGAGAVIISDVPDYAVVVGNPGKVIKFNKI